MYAGTIPARVGGTGTEFFGVREYQFGDSPRTINWRVSARHAENLYSNEYQQERVADVGIVLDARASTNLFHANKSIFEHKVTAAAALSDAVPVAGKSRGTYSCTAVFSVGHSPGMEKSNASASCKTLARAEVGVSSVFAGLGAFIPAHVPA